MKQDRKSAAVLALLGAISVTKAIKLAPSELQGMYTDPEYADTWRWTKDPRYVNEQQWDDDIPSGYDTGLAMSEADMRSSLDVPDYWSWDYGGEKHWKFANDKFYADPDEWIKSSPKGYDDYVQDETVAQMQENNIPGVTFYPGRKPQQLAQAESKTEIPDYWSWDYGGEKHWKFANDKFYADPEEWIKSAPKGYDIEEFDSFAQTGRNRGGAQGLVQVDRRHKWDNKIPNPSAWTQEHYDSSNEEEYNNDAPKGIPPNFVQKHSRHGRRHHKSQRHQAQKMHQRSSKHAQPKHKKQHGKRKHHHSKQKKHHSVARPNRQQYAPPAGVNFAPGNFIYPAGTHSQIVPYVVRDEAWNDAEYNASDEKQYDEDRPSGYYE